MSHASTTAELAIMALPLAAPAARPTPLWEPTVPASATPATQWTAQATASSATTHVRHVKTRFPQVVSLASLSRPFRQTAAVNATAASQ